jgi:hypothetical protein
MSLAIPGVAGDDEVFLAGLDTLPPADRYRQLSLMLMVTDGADQALVDALGARLDEAGADREQGGRPGFDFDQYTTPLIRIVDQESMLEGATRLFMFTRAHAAAIGDQIGRLRDSNGDGVGPALEAAIAEDAIIIRNAIADSIDYATLEDEEAAGGLSKDYRARTIYLRNNLEFELFSAELDRITRDAVASVGGKTDAYERMFDEEVDSAALDKKIRAAEYAYGWDREFDERAAKMAEEILNNIWDRESGMDP